MIQLERSHYILRADLAVLEQALAPLDLNDPATIDQLAQTSVAPLSLQTRYSLLRTNYCDGTAEFFGVPSWRSDYYLVLAAMSRWVEQHLDSRPMVSYTTSTHDKDSCLLGGPQPLRCSLLSIADILNLRAPAEKGDTEATEPDPV